jgi:hypothetical protein
MNPPESPDVARWRFHPAWSSSLGSSPAGLTLAREKDWLLVWDQANWLYLLTHAGQRQGQFHFPDTLAAACCADDGSAYAAVGAKGEVIWLAPDLMPRWQHTLPHPALAVATDSFGQYLAVADARGHLIFFDNQGRETARLQTPRPMHHLAFVPAAPVLIGSADYGLVAAFALDGSTRWRDGLVAHAGALSVNGDGSKILVACFSEGLQGYDLEGKKLERLPVIEPYRLVSQSFTGQAILVAGMSNRLLLLDQAGRALGEQSTDKPIAAIALSALGDHATAAFSDGPIVRWNIRRAGG